LKNFIFKKTVGDLKKNMSEQFLENMKYVKGNCNSQTSKSFEHLHKAFLDRLNKSPEEIFSKVENLEIKNEKEILNNDYEEINDSSHVNNNNNNNVNLLFLFNTTSPSNRKPILINQIKKKTLYEKILFEEMKKVKLDKEKCENTQQLIKSPETNISRSCKKGSLSAASVFPSKSSTSSKYPTHIYSTKSPTLTYSSPGKPSPGKPSPGKPSPGKPSPEKASPGKPNPGKPSPLSPSYPSPFNSSKNTLNIVPSPVLYYSIIIIN
jgi:hypothetical protein